MSNSKAKATLEFDLADAPMLAELLQYGSARALCDSKRWAQERYRKYEQIIAQMIPDEAKHFDERDWAHMAATLADAIAFKVSLVAAWTHDKSYFHKGRIQIDIVLADGSTKTWKSDGYDFEKGDPRIQAVHAVISEMAPMDCKAELEDLAEQSYRW